MSQHEMNTRSRRRQQSAQGSASPTLNGSFTSSSSAVDPSADGLTSTRHANGNGTPSKQPSTPVKRRSGITRVSVNTWNMIVRKWEIPRKTLHVSIGMT